MVTTQNKKQENRKKTKKTNTRNTYMVTNWCEGSFSYTSRIFYANQLSCQFVFFSFLLWSFTIRVTMQMLQHRLMQSFRSRESIFSFNIFRFLFGLSVGSMFITSFGDVFYTSSSDSKKVLDFSPRSSENSTTNTALSCTIFISRVHKIQRNDSSLSDVFLSFFPAWRGLSAR